MAAPGPVNPNGDGIARLDHRDPLDHRGPLDHRDPAASHPARAHSHPAARLPPRGRPAPTGPGGCSSPPAAKQGPPRAARAGPGPPGPPGLIVDLEPLPVTSCDHRHYSAGHDPSPRLRHLVEVRDGECDYPPCRRAAARCDFEHTIAWEDGGATCSCNAGPRCRHHHHTKQHPGWRLEQHLPGYRTWTTPAGRTIHHRTHHLPDLTPGADGVGALGVGGLADHDQDRVRDHDQDRGEQSAAGMARPATVWAAGAEAASAHYAASCPPALNTAAYSRVFRSCSAKATRRFPSQPDHVTVGVVRYETMPT